MAGFISIVADKKSFNFLRTGRDESGEDKNVALTNSPTEAPVKQETAPASFTCGGTSRLAPATLVEMTLGTSKSPLHYYDVSLINGFNVPISMAPANGSLGCDVAAYEDDLNQYCPFSLVLKREWKVVGCKSACLAAKSDRFCCREDFANPKTCKATLFGLIFKAICPNAYSFSV